LKGKALMKHQKISATLSITLLLIAASSVVSCASASRKASNLQTQETGAPNEGGGQVFQANSNNANQNIAANDSAQSDADTVVSSPVNNDNHEWTMEEMLLAQPMPMSQEERDFIFKNKSVQKIQEWNLADFTTYAAHPIGKRELQNEGTRWADIRKMVRAQASFGRDFLAGKASKPSPPPASALPPEPAPPEQPAATGDGNSSQPGASSPGYAGDDGGGGTPSMGLNRIKDPLTVLLGKEGAFTGAQAEKTLNELKSCRSDISKACKELDEIKKEAAKRNLTQVFENAINAVSWD
jgi:hypothetical protein